MNVENINPLEKGIACSIDLDAKLDKTAGGMSFKQYVELMTPSKGEWIALEIMLSREEPVGGIKDMKDPPQAFLDLVQTIIDRYRAGEWAGSEAGEAPEIITTSSSGPEPGLGAIQQLDKSQLPDGKSGIDINAIYYEGSLLWAVTPRPDTPQDRHEHFQGEAFEMGQAIDAFLENAAAEEIEKFKELDESWSRW